MARKPPQPQARPNGGLTKYFLATEAVLVDDRAELDPVYLDSVGALCEYIADNMSLADNDKPALRDAILEWAIEALPGSVLTPSEQSPHLVVCLGAAAPEVRALEQRQQTVTTWLCVFP